VPRRGVKSDGKEAARSAVRIEGRVVDSSGQPVAGAGINGSLQLRGLTGSNGEFTLDDPEAGTYSLFVQPPIGYTVIDLLPVVVAARGRSPVVIRLGTGAASVTGPRDPSGMTSPQASTGPSGPSGSMRAAPVFGGFSSATSPGGSYPPSFTGPCGQGFTFPTIEDLGSFFATLDSPDLSIEAPLSEAEAIQAISLFSVVNVYLGGVSTRRVGNDDKMDVLGMLTLYYGLQDKSLTSKIVIRTPDLWTEIQDELKGLRDELELLGGDVVFLAREARRQFNLGFNHDVAGNLDFPRLFQEYVDMAGDPLLTLDLSLEETSTFSDKTQVARAYDLLSQLKDLSVEIVRTASKNGTVATSQVNQQWANYERRALAVLKQVAEARISDDADDLRILSVVSDLTGKDFSAEVAPYIALARDGGCLLNLAMEVYRNSARQLDNYDRAELLRVFQSGTPDMFLTTRIRNRAIVIKKYPLRNWGTS
jgi:hypothetical protein